MRAGILLLLSGFALASCGGAPKIQAYPTPPSVKGLSEPGACTGGEKLAARHLVLPDFPKRALRQGRQGWVIVKLDVTPEGKTSNLTVRDSAPVGIFDKSALNAVAKWDFAPPGPKGLQGCLVFINYHMGKVAIGK